MPSRKDYKLRVTTRQGKRLRAVIEFFGERGYFVCPVAKCYRRHRLDMVAIPKGVFEMLVLILPGRGETIELRPYNGRGLWLSRDLRKRRKTLPGVRWKRPLPRRLHSDWRDYISAYHQRELKRLMREM